ncbi:hypothetical protein DFQ05_0579 [Winogradskyella wandonensis]|uniref:Uncharacterized protein n=1 Tax=Winogradskyella wandonensis TaxID=1442586 RepID=A0A4R1KWI6_9FLAO|nr:hypothetical protein [Winogradskyella wandonensis]TCK69067.1 hypothetical protein DFQ05_0579 [Winogradskyella wandonensis]
MKYFKYFLFILLFSAVGQSQNPNKFAGFIKLQDTLLIKYKVEFNEDNGLVSGYSFTDFGGEHETKSRIEGYYNDDKKEISFKEVELIYTKSPVSLDDFDFCNINFISKRFKLGSDKMMGDFKGTFSDGAKCLNGELAMNSVEKIQKRISKFSKKVKNSNRIADSIKTKVQNIKIIDTLNLNVLKKNQITTIPTSSKSLKLFIYDGGQIDDDIVTIYVDDKSLLTKYRISKAKKILEIPINKEITKIKVLSEAVGSIGSNTAIIEIYDGKNTIKTMTNLEKGETTEIDVVRKQ